MADSKKFAKEGKPVKLWKATTSKLKRIAEKEGIDGSYDKIINYLIYVYEFGGKRL